MADDHNVMLIFKGRQGWSQPGHDVDVGLAPRVAVAKFVLVPPCEFLREALLHFFVGQALADALEKI